MDGSDAIRARSIENSVGVFVEQTRRQIQLDRLGSRQLDKLMLPLLMSCLRHTHHESLKVAAQFIERHSELRMNALTKPLAMPRFALTREGDGEILAHVWEFETIEPECSHAAMGWDEPVIASIPYADSNTIFS